jgi:methionyl-tRNA synthetase
MTELARRRHVAGFERTLVTAALPYANGPIHLGHLAGVYVPADIYVRFLRLTGREVLFICGSDEHGVPITLTAEREGIAPKQLVDRNYGSILKSFEGLGIHFDNYSQTSRPIHIETSQAFFTDLHARGILRQNNTLQFYSEATQRFLPDRYVEGRCPHCDSTRARGDQCESCGSQIDADTLLEPRSAIDGSPVALRETTHWFLPLGEMQPWLAEWIGSKTDWKENVVNYCNGWFQQGLGDRAVTRDLHWGVPVPLPDHDGKVLYVWFDAPIGYISATKEWAIEHGNPEGWRRWWQDPSTRLVHFIGKDNIVFHAILFPAMLHAHSEDYIVPDNVPANEFLNLEGNKLSTSRGYAVWLPDYLEKFQPDSLRYCLARNLPETRDTNFSWDDFQARHNNELADALGNFVNRTLTFVHKYFAGRVPSSAKCTDIDRAALAGMEEEAQKIHAQMDRFQIRAASESLFLLAKAANRYFDEVQPWATRKDDLERCAASLYVCCQFLRYFSGLWAMLLPYSMEKLWVALGVEGRLVEDGWPGPDRLLPAGHLLGHCEILFAKIEDEAIARERERLSTLPAEG